VTLAALSAVSYAAVVTYAATREAKLAPVVASVGALGAALLLFVLVRGHDDLLGWALAIGGIVYAMTLVLHGSQVDEAAPLVGAALLGCGELAAWSLDERWPARADRGLAASRAVAVGGLCLAGLAAATIVVSLAAAPVGRGLGWTVLGATAAVLVVATAARLARRGPDSERR
jgi:hypothetical protein